jgi:hypothetical protein
MKGYPPISFFMGLAKNLPEKHGLAVLNAQKALFC